MGREWLYWVGGGGSGGRSSTRRGRMSGETEEAANSAGCMCAVFQLFDLRHFQIPLNEQASDFKPDEYFLQEEVTTSKGVEAPRNSLELEEPAAIKAASMSLAMKEEEEDLNFPVGIKIKTNYDKTSSPRVSASALKSRTDDFSSECSSNSPGTKTPNLVARLMGLDLLPECSSPSFSSSNSKPPSKSHLHKNHQKTHRNFSQSRPNKSFFDDDISAGARSLPETPRISSARRSDVEIHRLSLQLNKENTSEDFAISAKTGGRMGRFRMQQPQEENRSPGHYAKQIVKQVKENVSRRVGVDITNRNRSEPIRRDENLVLLKPTKNNPSIMSGYDGVISLQRNQPITPSYSPKLWFSETNKNKPVRNSNTKSPKVLTSFDYNQSQGIINPLKPKPQVLQEHEQQKKDSKRIGNGRCNLSRLKKLPPQASEHAIRNKKDEPFVCSPAANKASLTDKKSKKNPISSDVLNISAPILLPVKKDPSPPVTKLPQKQSQVSDALSSKRRTQLSSNSSQSYKLQMNSDKIFNVPENVQPDNPNGYATTPSSATAEYKNYIQKILKRTRTKCHSSSQPLDPTIFHFLELFHSTTTSADVLSRRCNRKLIFHLVDELLAEILRPHFDVKKWNPPVASNDHFPLVDELCKKIGNFPAAKCEVLEDIDTLIDRDLRTLSLSKSLEEEEESITCDIAGEILESLVRETAAMVGYRTAEEQRQRAADFTWRLSRDEMPLVGIVGPQF